MFCVTGRHFDTIGKREKAEVKIAADFTYPAWELNKVPPQYKWLEKPARATCRSCGLYDDLSLCRECPLTLYIGRLMNANGE